MTDGNYYQHGSRWCNGMSIFGSRLVAEALASAGHVARRGIA